MKVVVVGIGIVSSLGLGVQQNYKSLMSKQSGITPSINPRNGSKIFSGRVPYSNNELCTFINVSKTIPRTSILGIMAAKEALLPLLSVDKSQYSMGFFSGTTVGGLDLSEQFFSHYIPNKSLEELHFLNHHTCGASSNDMQDYLPKMDYHVSYNTACSSSANSIISGSRKLRNNDIDFALVGGSDALSEFTINGFHSLMIYDDEPCHPFDDARKGLNLGEGAAYLLLCSEKKAVEMNLPILCEFAGYGNANDAFHATASSPEGKGAQLAMQKAMDRANISPNQVSYINLHGTGTSNNDLTEGKAIEEVFQDDLPLVSSTKSYTGHTLGASGAIEAVFSCLSLTKQCAFPTLRWKNKIDGLKVKSFMDPIQQKIDCCMSNSFGFGGFCSSLIFKKV
ncbi:MAG: beta-ketoacyl-[acyl-carrier-protein] synthase family protein [Bacteroidales bacterium]